MPAPVIATGAQIRAARALLRWSAERLAEEAKVHRNTVRRAELVDGVPNVTAANLDAMARALGVAGVQFIQPNGGGPGVRLRHQVGDEPAERETDAP